MESRIKAIHQWYYERKLSCEELTRCYLQRIQREQPRLNAYITCTQEHALRQARTVDGKLSRKERLMPLEGIPMTLKDNISTRGIRTTCASKMLHEYVPDRKSVV